MQLASTHIGENTVWKSIYLFLLLYIYIFCFLVLKLKLEWGQGLMFVVQPYNLTYLSDIHLSVRFQKYENELI